MTKSIEDIVVTGRLEDLTPDQRTAYYLQVCEGLGIDFRLHPLEYLDEEDGHGHKRLILYVLKNGTDQLRKVKGIQITDVTNQMIDGVLVFTAKAVDKDGHTDIATGAVDLRNKSGQEKANAIMAAETKAKRRVTLAISGVGLMDETEVADRNKVTSVTPGVGVSTPPAQLSTPAVNNAAGAEVPPEAPPPQQGPDPRIKFYRDEVLQAGGIQSEPGLPIAAKWMKYLRSKFPGCKSTKEITNEKWKPVLDELDQVRVKMGDKGVVFHIEQTIKEKTA